MNRKKGIITLIAAIAVLAGLTFIAVFGLDSGKDRKSVV